MAKLTYSVITSLDGYVADENGRFDWAEPDEEVHTLINDLQRRVGTYLYGRRMYEVMVAWETITLAGQPPFIRDFAETWRAADKIVYSTTLEEAPSARTRIERDFDPEAVRQMKERAGRDLSVGGPHLAAQVIRAGLVDDWPPVRGAHRRGGRYAVTPQRRPPDPRAARRGSLRGRHGSPSLSDQDMRGPRPTPGAIHLRLHRSTYPAPGGGIGSTRPLVGPELSISALPVCLTGDHPRRREP